MLPVPILPRTAALLALLAGAPPAWGEDLAAGDDLVARLEVCYDFGCRSRHTVYLFESDWQAVSALLRDARGAADERARIAEAVGLMERITATMAPTGVDRAFNDDGGLGFKGQLDCIDESTNTTRYLELFQARGLLTHHRVHERVLRATALVFEHWSAQIEEVATGRRYVVDSWYRNNGEPALVLPVEAWRRRNVGPLGES